MQRLALTVATIVVLTLAASTAAGPVQKIRVTMRDFGYTPSTITLQSGVPAELTFVNNGKLAHEFMLYDRPKAMGMMMGGEEGHEWVEETNYFHMMPVTATGGRVRRHQGDFMELTVSAGKTASLRFTPQKKGTFEMGCMIKDHYEAGQHGVVIVK
jgi:uncharacterized cupredoxin-like copper-binding protein